MFQTPVLCIAFNRPDLAQKLVNQLSLIRPAHLYVAIDGPRSSRPNEKDLCSQVKKVFDNLSWPANVHFLIQNENKGCKVAVSSAIDWFFQNVEAGIILEDDCIPNISFFSYCQELLSRFENEPTVMAISGDNFSNLTAENGSSYFFSRFVHIWGWATWKRAWAKYNVSIPDWSHDEIKTISKILPNKNVVRYWVECFDAVRAGKINTWDYQWVWTVWKNGGVCIIPNVNLIENIGFDERATHTKVVNPEMLLKGSEIKMPLVHNSEIKIHFDSDKIVAKKFFTKKNILQKIISRIF